MKLQELNRLGQAVWLDYIRRSFIVSGELQGMVDAGVRGVTSNPTIFEKAIAGSADYDEDLRRLVREGRSDGEIYQALTVEDIRLAADVFLPLYGSSGGADGYVSLEVSPELAHDTNGTVVEGRRLFATVNRPNVMIKVPATPAGVRAIPVLIGEGININVTLIFSIAQYEPVAAAYLQGLENLSKSGGNVEKVASVASFFVSRVDAAVDVELGKQGIAAPPDKVAIDNVKSAYARFREIFRGERWERLAAKGARVQRPLWASTGAKDPLLPDTLYVDSLVGPDTVNTVPPATLNAFLDHGAVGSTLETGVEEARSRLAALPERGIDLERLAQGLQDDGVAAFAGSHRSLMKSIAEKRVRLLSGWAPMSESLGSHRGAVDRALAELKGRQVMRRIWAHDHTVWKPGSAEIRNRLGWLNVAEVMAANTKPMRELADTLRAEGYTDALLLGMGGSSLAPEVFRKTFGVKDGYLDLAVLDSTVPGAVLAQAERLDPAKTVFLVSTKSGDTAETLSFFKFFHNRVTEAVGRGRAGEHFVAITDPGSKLAEIAQAHRFRKTFFNDPNIGGRYSALSYFGLVPAALIGVDLDTLLDRAMTAACNCEGCNCPVGGDNRGARLGIILGELSLAGRDKLTLIASPAIGAFGNWVEQLIAESTGKEGRGIVPVVGEPPGPPEVYGKDRLFVYLRLEGDDSLDGAVQDLENAGHPVVRLRLKDPYDLGGQIFLWEMATAVAGHRIGINPFDQPNVESAKILARRMLDDYRKEGRLPSLVPTLRAGGIAVYGDVLAETPGDALIAFLGQALPGDYVALQAYVQPGAGIDHALLALRSFLRDRYKMATTVGYGPRFLHSTGQMHKGDAGRGLFLQWTADDPLDVPIPDEAGSPASSVTFGILKTAQALGDRQALLDAGRRVLRIHLGPDPLVGFTSLTEALP
ncbi:MAG: transaldolase [Deltaproteobacteria bacterium CG2_30_66_27]|nr:MAG: transaldolase [Deltaproteobacteria bacterium CG2_30_66_27]